MDINYFGQSAFKIKSKGASVVTDPFTPDKVGLAFPKLSEIDIVTISHSHFDHNFLGNIKDPKMVIDAPGEYEISGISVIGLQSFHDEKKGEERGENTIFIFEVEGIRIVHLGDLGHKLSENIIEEMGTVDVLMVPVGGFYTIGAQKAAEVVREIEPSIVIPMHYKLPQLKKDFSDSLSPAEDFLKETGLLVEKMDKLSIKKFDISQEESKVIVLSVPRP